MHLRIITGTSHPRLAWRVADWTGIPAGDAQVDRFPDGEIRVQIEESVQGAQVVMIQPTSSAESILELLLLTDALKRDNPSELIVVIPFFGYGRQERRVSRGPVSAEVMARLLNHSGADRLITVDLHAPVISSFFTLPHHELHTAELFAAYIQSQIPPGQPVVVVSPDAGGRARADRLNEALNTGRPAIVLEKVRLGPDQCQIAFPESGNLEGIRVVLYDDITSTGGTLVKAAEGLAQRGAKDVWACITHLVAAQALSQRLANSPIERLIVTDSLPIPPSILGSNIHILSLAPLLGSAVLAHAPEERREILETVHDLPLKGQAAFAKVGCPPFRLAYGKFAKMRAKRPTRSPAGPD